MKISRIYRIPCLCNGPTLTTDINLLALENPKTAKCFFMGAIYAYQVYEPVLYPRPLVVSGVKWGQRERKKNEKTSK